MFVCYVVHLIMNCHHLIVRNISELDGEFRRSAQGQLEIRSSMCSVGTPIPSSLLIDSATEPYKHGHRTIMNH